MSEPSEETWLVYSDGASRGNPGPASIGSVVIDANGVERHHVSESIGIATNNVAEYRAIIAGLEAALALGASRVEVRMDSELIVRQVIGRYRVRNPGLMPYFQTLMALKGRFQDIAFRHVPRNLNKRADGLANAALNRGQSWS